MSWNSNKSSSRLSEPNSLNESTISYKSSINSVSNHLPPLNTTSTTINSRVNSSKNLTKNSSKLNLGSEDIVKKLEVRIISLKTISKINNCYYYSFKKGLNKSQ